MWKRDMIVLFIMSVVALVWTDANAGCSIVQGKRMCAKWIRGSAKCLASIDDTLAVSGTCEVGGTVKTQPNGLPCGPFGKTGELGECDIKGIISCANNQATTKLLSGTSSSGGHNGDDDHGAVPRFKTRQTLVSDKEFVATTTKLSCNDNDCRMTHELDLSEGPEGSGEKACEAKLLHGFDTFTPSKGFMKFQFCDGFGLCTGVIERCTIQTNVCGQPYNCSVVATFDFKK
jgi:hypothetical protein